VLEPYDGKLSRTVLRGVWAGNRLNLPDLDLRGNLSDVAKLDAELIFSSAILRVMRMDLFVAERFELRESFSESYGQV
jgi:hypothetical protein